MAYFSNAHSLLKYFQLLLKQLTVSTHDKNLLEWSMKIADQVAKDEEGKDLLVGSLKQAREYEFLEISSERNELQTKRPQQKPVLNSNPADLVLNIRSYQLDIIENETSICEQGCLTEKEFEHKRLVDNLALAIKNFPKLLNPVRQFYTVLRNTVGIDHEIREWKTLTGINQQFGTNSQSLEENVVSQTIHFTDLNQFIIDNLDPHILIMPFRNLSSVALGYLWSENCDQQQFFRSLIANSSKNHTEENNFGTENDIQQMLKTNPSIDNGYQDGAEELNLLFKWIKIRPLHYNKITHFQIKGS